MWKWLKELKETNKVKQFIKEHYKILINMHAEKLKEYCNKYGMPFNPDLKNRIISMHKARIHCQTIPENEKEISREWLKKNRYWL